MQKAKLDLAQANVRSATESRWNGFAPSLSQCWAGKGAHIAAPFPLKTHPGSKKLYEKEDSTQQHLSDPNISGSSRIGIKSTFRLTPYWNHIRFQAHFRIGKCTMCSQPSVDKWARSPGSGRCPCRIAAAQKRGVVFGPRPGQRVKAAVSRPKCVSGRIGRIQAYFRADPSVGDCRPNRLAMPYSHVTDKPDLS